MDGIVAKLRKNSHAEIWVQLCDYQGRQYLDLREHFRSEQDATWLPTKKGLRLQMNLIHNLATGLDKLASADDLCTVHVIQKGRAEEIRIGLREFVKARYGEIRLWFSGDDGEMRPSQKGITFPQDLATSIAEALQTSEGLIVNSETPVFEI